MVGRVYCAADGQLVILGYGQRGTSSNAVAERRVDEPTTRSSAENEAARAASSAVGNDVDMRSISAGKRPLEPGSDDGVVR